MAAVARPPVPDKALPPEPTLHDSPSHASLEPAEPGPGSVSVPFPRQSVAGAQSSGDPDSGSKQLAAAIEDCSAPRSGALPSQPRSDSEATPAASVGHTAVGSHHGAGRTPGSLADTHYLPSTAPVQAPYSRQTKDDDLPPLPTPDAEPSASTTGLFRRITKKLRPVVAPVDPLDAPPTSFQISLPTTSRRRSRSRPRGDSASGANAPQPQVGRQRKPNMRIPAVPIPKAPAPGAVPNSFTSAENRRAALRARGLVPASSKNPRYRDAHGDWMPLSEQEKELDRMFAIVVEDRSPSAGNEESEAKKFRDAWLARHRSESELDHDQAMGASPSSDAHFNGGAVYADGSGSAVPSTTDLAHSLAAPAEPNKHARQPSGGVMRGRIFSASAENFRPDLMPLVDPSLPEIPFEQAAAHRLPQARDRHSSDVSERVSRWLQTSLRPRSRSASASRPASAGAADGEGKQGRARFGLFSRRRSIDASIIPTPYCKESDARRSADVGGWAHGSRMSFDSAPPGAQASGRRTPARKLPPVPPSAFTPVKEKYDTSAVIITTSPTDVSPTSDTPAISLAQANSSRTSLDSQTLRVRRVQVGHRRGRSTTVSDPQQHAPLESSSSLVSRSHSHTMPALSPTRSTSSSEVGLPATPTTDTHGCDPPPPPPREHNHLALSAGRSQSQQNHSQHHQPTRQASQNSLSRAKSMPRPAPTQPVPPLPQRPAAADESAVQDDHCTDSDIDSSYVEVEVDVEFGVRMRSEAQKMRDLMEAAATASARPRPRRESADEPERRRSVALGIFTKKEDVNAPPKFRNPRATTSMQNMKRNLTGTLASLKPRPKTIVEDNAHGEAPPSPPAHTPPTSFPQAMATPKRRKNSAAQEQSLSPIRSSVGSGPRPRQALSPTIHDRGSILIQAGRIEDDESRRLSEMAFLDY